LRPRPIGRLEPQTILPECMRRTTEATDLMAQMREALDRPDEQVVVGGVIFVGTTTTVALPHPDEAAVYSAPLPSMDFFRWPLSALARRVAWIVRKLAAPLMRRQERFNMEFLAAVRRLESRLESQQLESRQLRLRIAELERRRPADQLEGEGA
jgi:hypothetical protein